jgi:phospholipase/lecithinase/hemolysin
VLFGDSLSDNGDGDGELFDHTYPLSPYYKFRFSNGPVWIELFPATNLLDFAYGGSLVNQTAPSFGGPGSLMSQINDYLIANHFDLSSVAEETLYVFWGGANDIYYELSNQTVTSQGVNDGVSELETGLPLLITDQIQKLIEAGAINILLMSVINWSYEPYGIESFSTAQLQSVTQFTNIVNQAVISNVSAIVPDGVNFHFFDYVAFISKIRANPEEFGFVDVTNPCLANYLLFETGVGGAPPIVCSNPDQHFFWDAYHPTARGHAIIASEVMKFIGWQG